MELYDKFPIEPILESYERYGSLSDLKEMTKEQLEKEKKSVMRDMVELEKEWENTKLKTGHIAPRYGIKEQMENIKWYLHKIEMQLANLQKEEEEAGHHELKRKQTRLEREEGI